MSSSLKQDKIQIHERQDKKKENWDESEGNGTQKKKKLPACLSPLSVGLEVGVPSLSAHPPGICPSLGA